MRMPLVRLVEMSNDTRISDAQFRNLVRNIMREDLRRCGVIKALDVLEQEAILETEREEYERKLVADDGRARGVDTLY